MMQYTEKTHPEHFDAAQRKLCRRYFEYLERKNTSPATIQDLRYNFLWFRKYLGQTKQFLTKETILNYYTYLKNEYRTKQGKKLLDETIHKRIYVLKGYCHYLYKTDRTICDIADTIELPRIRRRILKDIPSEKEIELILEKPKKDIWGLRDRAILELLYGTGLRNKEVCNLKLYDIDLQGKQVYVRNTKNKQDRIVPISREAKKMLEEYLAKRQKNFSSRRKPGSWWKKEKEKDMVFYSAYWIPMKQRVVAKIVRKYRLKTRTVPHSLRHACAIGMMRNKAPIRSIQELLGHKKLSSTQIYTQVTINDLHDAHEKYHPRG